MYFKSSPARDSLPGREFSGHSVAGEKEGFLHLCSDEKVWAVKQVSTSNSVHVTRTVSADGTRSQENERRDGIGDRDTTMDGVDEQPVNTDDKVSGDLDLAQTTGGITLISQVKNILELIPVPPPTQAEVEAMIREIVPIYGDDDTEGDRYSAFNPPNISMQKGVFDSIPAPTKSIFEARKRLLLFDDPGHTFIPSTKFLLKTWKVFTESCDITGLKLDRNDGIHDSDIDKAVREFHHSFSDYSEQSNAEDLAFAIFQLFRLDLPPDNDEIVAEAMREGAEWEPCEENIGFWFDPVATRDAVGKWLLASITHQKTSLSELRLDSNDTLPVVDFLDGWKQLLPDSWAEQCDVLALVSGVGGWEIIKHDLGEAMMRKSSENKSDKDPAQVERAKAQNRKKGKWHGKFGEQRRAAVKT